MNALPCLLQSATFRGQLRRGRVAEVYSSATLFSALAWKMRKNPGGAAYVNDRDEVDIQGRGSHRLLDPKPGTRICVSRPYTDQLGRDGAQVTVENALTVGKSGRRGG